MGREGGGGVSQKNYAMTHKCNVDVQKILMELRKQFY